MIKIENLLTQSGEWLKGTGPDSDVVISSRLRLARNLSPFQFLTAAPQDVRKEIDAVVKDRIPERLGNKKLHYMSLNPLTALDRHLLVERHLISKEHATGEGERSIVIGNDETISIMINEEDHLRLQVLRSGFELNDAWQELNQLDDVLGERLEYAFHSQFGFLTACPTNVGTGLRISVMLHLPALVIAKQVDKVLQSLSRINYTVRGLFGEGTPAMGDFYQISNQITLGKVEEDMIAEIKNVLPQIIQFERSWRQRLMEEDPEKMEDRVWRACGILKNARSITTEETMDYLSILRLGVNLHLIEGIPPSLVNELFIFTQPSHLQKIEKKSLEPRERDVIRASFVRSKLASLAEN